MSAPEPTHYEVLGITRTPTPSSSSAPTAPPVRNPFPWESGYQTSAPDSPAAETPSAHRPRRDAGRSAAPGPARGNPPRILISLLVLLTLTPIVLIGGALALGQQSAREGMGGVAVHLIATLLAYKVAVARIGNRNTALYAAYLAFVVLCLALTIGDLGVFVYGASWTALFVATVESTRRRHSTGA